MKTCLLTIVLILLTAIGVNAQAPGVLVRNGDGAAKLTTIELTREHQLELLVFELRVENAQLKVNLAKATSDALGLEGQLLGGQLTTEQKTLSEKMTRALGGDPTKGDTFNWKTKTLVRASPPPPAARDGKQ